MKLKQYLILLCLLGMGITPLFSQKTTEQPQNWEAGTPGRSAYQRMDFSLAPGFTDNDIRVATQQRLPELEASQTSLEQKYRKESPNGIHITYVQNFQGTPIYGALLKVNMMKTGRVLNFMNNLESGFQQTILGGFDHSEQEVTQIVTSEYEMGQRFDLEVEKTWYVTENGLLPAYKVITTGNNVNGAWELVYDARDLSEIVKHDRIVRHHPPSIPSITATGTGCVWLPDPLTTAGVQYGGNYTDQNDADVQVLNDERVTVTLKDITLDNGTYKLEGPHVRIYDEEAPNTAPATSTDGDFCFTRSESGFEDVMCYWHVDSLQRYIQGLGFTNLLNNSFGIDPHGLSGQDNSHYVSGGGSFGPYCSFGEGGVDDAEDADVITHEYGHALSDDVSPSTNNGFERRGLDEGFGDYIAASWSHHFDSYRWDDVFTWDGHNTFWNGRDASISGNYPPATGGWNFYAYGEVWATVLMEAYLDPSVGQTVSDMNFYAELYENVGNMTTKDAALLIIDADLMNYSGSHEATYRDIFCNRNILSGADCVVGRADELGMGLKYRMYPNPADAQFTVELDQMQPGQDARVEVMNMVGQTLKVVDLNNNVTRINTENLEAGVYLIRISVDGAPVATEKLVIQ